jgi:hypothetical protein
MTPGEKEISFIYPLSDGYEDRLRVVAQTQKGQVSRFVVQYEALIKEKWTPIVRYDTSRGFSHKDIIHYDGNVEKQPLYFQNFNMALTFAIQDLKTSWKWYKMSYEREMENEERAGH